MVMSLYLGIDLGTTNSVASIAHEGVNGNIEIETLKITQIGEDGVTPVEKELFPSVLYVENGEKYVGEFAKAMKTQKRKNIISSSKNFMGENQVWTIEGKKYSPKIAASYILKSVRNHVEFVYGNRIDLSSAVITVPASFDQDQKSDTREAARLAGFDGDKLVLISEPTAALLDYINEQRKYKDDSKYIDFSKTKKVLVFDLGGGTCDVSIIEVQIQEDTVKVNELAVSEHTLVGGVNFDNYAVEGIINSYNKRNGTNLKKELSCDDYDELYNQLSIRCEMAKLFFSGRYNIFKTKENCDTLLNDLNYPISIPNIIDGKAFAYKLKFNEYNKFIEPLLKSSHRGVKNITDPILNTLEAAKLDIQDIDYVFSVGGMTMYPAIINNLKELFNKEPLSVMDRMQSVSRGAAVYQHYNVMINESQLEENKKSDISVIPSMPQSVFLNVKNGFPITLIEAGTKAGTPKTHEKLIRVSSETSAELELYTGKNFYDPDMKKLKSMTLDFPRGVQKGEGISLKIEYTPNGMLNFDAWVTNDKNMRIGISLDREIKDEIKLKEIQNEYKIDQLKGVY